MVESVLASLFKKPATTRYPFEKFTMPARFRGKPVFHSEKCTGCKLCIRDCPSQAITITKVGEKQYESLIEARDAGASTPGTHSLARGVLVDYLGRELGCGVTIIGIQPRSLELGGGLSSEVETAVGEVVRTIRLYWASAVAFPAGRLASSR